MYILRLLNEITFKFLCKINIFRNNNDTFYAYVAQKRAPFFCFYKIVVIGYFGLYCVGFLKLACNILKLRKDIDIICTEVAC